MAKENEESELDKLKKQKDEEFRNEAKKEVLVPLTDLNAEIRQHIQSLKGNPAKIERQRLEVNKIEKENNRIRYQIKKLRKEQQTADDERKLEIEIILGKPEYKTKSAADAKNLLNALEGKDFNFRVNDLFERYNINTKEFKKYWERGEDATIVLLKKMQENNDDAIRYYEREIERLKNTATKGELKRLNRIKTALGEKLSFIIEKNIEAIETGDKSVLDDESDGGDKAYSILVKLVGLSIDRIGI